MEPAQYSYLKSIVEKDQSGDFLTDKELEDIIVLFTRLEEDLSVMGESFRLAHYPIVLRLHEFKSYARARKEKLEKS